MKHQVVSSPKKSRVTMSPLMHQMLNYSEENNISLEDLRRVRQDTVGALLKRNCLERIGNNVTITRFGRISLEQYRHSGLPERGFERDLTDHVKSLLQLVRAKAARKAA